MGAYALVEARDGRITLGEQGSAGGLGGPYPDSVLPLTKDEREVFGDGLGVFPQNATLTPRFPRSGELAAAAWDASHASTVDGVAAVDPVMLSYLLRATGPVAVPGTDREVVELTSENAVQILLNEIYLAKRDDPAVQDAFFAAAAKKVFQRVARGGFDSATLLEALRQGVHEDRLLLWSRSTSEQKELTTSSLGGQIGSRSPANPFVGVYLNDQSASKFDYYLDTSVDVVSTRCTGPTDQRRQEIEVAVTLTSRLPQNVDSLGRSILGQSRPRGFMVTNLFVYFPPGAEVLDGTTTSRTSASGELSSSPSSVGEAVDAGYPVQRVSLGLDPGETGTITWRFLAPPGLDGPVDLQVTPQVRPVPVEIGESTC